MGRIFSFASKSELAALEDVRRRAPEATDSLERARRFVDTIRALVEQKVREASEPR